jgi:tRNA A-37 threonylcarbamoyl transferase component Bud32
MEATIQEDIIDKIQDTSLRSDFAVWTRNALESARSEFGEAFSAVDRLVGYRIAAQTSIEGTMNTYEQRREHANAWVVAYIMSMEKPDLRQLDHMVAVLNGEAEDISVRAAEQELAAEIDRKLDSIENAVAAIDMYLQVDEQNLAGFEGTTGWEEMKAAMEQGDDAVAGWLRGLEKTIERNIRELRRVDLTEEQYTRVVDAAAGYLKLHIEDKRLSIIGLLTTIIDKNASRYPNAISVDTFEILLAGFVKNYFVTWEMINASKVLRNVVAGLMRASYEAGDTILLDNIVTRMLGLQEGDYTVAYDEREKLSQVIKKFGIHEAVFESVCRVKGIDIDSMSGREVENIPGIRVNDAIMDRLSELPGLPERLLNTENFSTMLTLLTSLRMVYDFKTFVETEDSILTNAFNGNIADRSNLSFRLSEDENGILWCTPSTGSFRRHVFFYTDNEGNILSHVSIKLPGEREDKSRVDLATGAKVDALEEEHRGITEGVVYEGNVKIEGAELYGRPFGDSVSFVVFDYEDGIRLRYGTVGSTIKVPGREDEQQKLKEEIALQVLRFALTMHNAGYVAYIVDHSADSLSDTDLHLENFKVVLDANEPSGFRVVQVSDLESLQLVNKDSRTFLQGEAYDLKNICAELVYYGYIPSATRAEELLAQAREEIQEETVEEGTTEDSQDEDMMTSLKDQDRLPGTTLRTDTVLENVRLLTGNSGIVQSELTHSYRLVQENNQNRVIEHRVRTADDAEVVFFTKEFHLDSNREISDSEMEAIDSECEIAEKAARLGVAPGFIRHDAYSAVMLRADGQNFASIDDISTDVVVETLFALGRLHAAGIVHRDLSSGRIDEHIFYAKDAPLGQRIQFVDFGIARQDSNASSSFESDMEDEVDTAMKVLDRWFDGYAPAEKEREMQRLYARARYGRELSETEWQALQEKQMEAAIGVIDDTPKDVAGWVITPISSDPDKASEKRTIKNWLKRLLRKLGNYKRPTFSRDYVYDPENMDDEALKDSFRESFSRVKREMEKEAFTDMDPKAVAFVPVGKEDLAWEVLIALYEYDEAAAHASFAVVVERDIMREGMIDVVNHTDFGIGLLNLKRSFDAQGATDTASIDPDMARRMNEYLQAISDVPVEIDFRDAAALQQLFEGKLTLPRLGRVDFNSWKERQEGLLAVMQSV